MASETLHKVAKTTNGFPATYNAFLNASKRYQTDTQHFVNSFSPSTEKR